MADEWQWVMRTDPESGEYGVFFTGGNQVSLPQAGSASVTQARVVLSNSFAPLPVVGHTYATAQFMGRGPTEFSFQVEGVGDYQLSRIQDMVEELEYNARNFRKIKGSSRVIFDENEFLKICGIEDGIVSHVQAETDSRGTDLYKLIIGFTSDGHHTESLNQELYQDVSVIDNALTVCLERIRVNLLTNAQRRALRAQDLEDQYNGGATPTGLIDQIRTLGSNIISGVEGVFQTTSNGNVAQAFRNEPIRISAGTNQDLAAYNYAHDGDHQWLNPYLERIRDILNEQRNQIPPSTFFRGEERGNYNDYTRGIGPETTETRTAEYQSSTPSQAERMAIQSNYTGASTLVPEDRETTATVTNPRLTATPRTFRDWPQPLDNANARLTTIVYGSKVQWESTDQIRQVLTDFISELRLVVQDVLGEMLQPGFNDVFPGLIESLANAADRTAHPTYMDLDLPPHPATGRVIDTEPDFYFYNDGEEGLLNEIGPEILNEINDRLDRVETSMGRLNDGTTWRETYLGRNRTADFTESLPEDESMSENEPTGFMDGGPGSGIIIDNATVSTDSSSESIQFTRNIMGGEAGQNIVDRVMSLTRLVDSSSNASQAKLLQRRRDMVRSSVFSFPDGTPNGVLGIGPIDSALDREDRSHSFTRNYIQSGVTQSLLQDPDETLTMRRAFPSFKIYFLEDDIGPDRAHLLPRGGSSIWSGAAPIMYMDDFYNWNSIKSIRLVRSRKNPADLLILELTNVTGLLERRAWTARPNEADQDFPREIYAPGFEGTQLENPLKRLILKEGLKVQARIGMTNNPQKMGKKFNGEIVELSFAGEGSDHVTIICQSFGAELMLDPKGTGEDESVTFTDTPDILHSIMCSPELAHFGRFNLNPRFNPAEARSAATSRDEDADGTYARVNPRVAIDEYRGILAMTRSRYILANNPADDNIFAPGIRDYLAGESTLGIDERTWEDIGSHIRFGGELIRRSVSNSSWSPASWPAALIGRFQAWLGSLFSSTSYVPNGQTVWEIFKECELRHPGWIAQPRPYGTRSTMFFGVPNFRYWADEISEREMLMLDALQNLFRRTSNRVSEEESSSVTIGRTIAGTDNTLHISGDSPFATFARFIRHRMDENEWLAGAGEYVAKTLGRYKPFRRFHLITDKHHILLNNIRVSDKGVINNAVVRWGGGEIYSLRADDNIPEEKVISQVFDYPSCNNETLARRYCIGLLTRHLKDAYKGEIVITGKDIDPHDQIYIHDDRSSMYGVFEVEQVVDTLTAETGWVTEITPDMVVGANEWSTVATKAAREAVAGMLIQKYSAEYTSFQNHMTETAGVIAGVGTAGILLGAPALVSAAGLAAGGLAAGGALAWMGGYYLVRWSQDRQPIWACPLILGERPLVAGLDGMRQDGVFASMRGEFLAEVDNVRRGWRQIHLGGIFSDIIVTESERAAGQLAQ